MPFLFVCYPGDSEDQPALGVTDHELFAIRRNVPASPMCTDYPRLDISEMFPFFVKIPGCDELFLFSS